MEDLFVGILDDVKRLGIVLNEDDRIEIEGICDRAKAEKKDELVRDTFIEYYIGEYFTIMRPEIMSALEADRTAQNKELIRDLGKQFDDTGKRICDEVGCMSTEGVGKCEYCERYICASHNYKKDGHSCYACYLENGGEPINRES
jgi:hypothetical protein